MTNADARVTYRNAFQSQIFQPPDEPRPRTAPAGRRRDQLVSEMFGSDVPDKQLQAVDCTFQPRGDFRSAKEKKRDDLAGGVLPQQQYFDEDGYGGAPPLRETYESIKVDHFADPINRRQAELKSDLFDRATPYSSEGISASEYVSKKLTPTDCQWNAFPESLQQTKGRMDVSDLRMRSFKEKCSTVWDREATEYEPRAPERGADVGAMLRKSNVYYSDLFDRQTPMQDQETSPQRFPKKGHQDPGDMIVSHADWTDARTELLRRAPGAGERTAGYSASDRKQQELHTNHLFDLTTRQTERPGDLITDTAGKVARPNDSIMASRKVAQAHLQSSMVADDFYQTAQDSRSWEVAEVRLLGLPTYADEGHVKALCRPAGCQVVKVIMDMDPVSNRCKGRAKVLLRYNPDSSNLQDMVDALAQRDVQVRM